MGSVITKRYVDISLKGLKGPFFCNHNASLPPPMKKNFDKSFGFAIHDVARLLRWSFDLQSQELGLTRAQWSVLAHLYRRDGIQQKTLAKIMEIKPISLTRQLDRLEVNSWIERRDDPSDRRAKNIYLTPKAKPMLKKLTKLGQQVQENALQGISAQERDNLISVLAKIRENLTDQG